MNGGDPGSTSALGGALRGHALRLADLVDELTPTAHAVHAGRVDHAVAERDLLVSTADELDRVGALLQQWTATTVDSLARLRQLDHQLAAAGLEVSGNKVVESLGPSRVDPDERLRSRELLQELLNRVTSARAKQLARLARELDASRTTLARLSDVARSGR
ncbi:hypothetical protein BA895_09725 [Humibacillus sp. DSM 29435]|uniref:hypothetical protein n=1 Tax=Humibacillus sp. DSM 29435 TaxID=1869167 RepID=UPI000871E475|nr:hypothetical protein [Humibacillus sp. DSM 29435]OFE14622.1 hypothetical protein BA895_09725 [Humibacillus sp. DSM 29435]